MRTCKKCGETKQLMEFPRYGATFHRYECRTCCQERRRRYEHPDYVPPKRNTRPVRPPVDFGKLYHRGTRCWCCRRDSRGEMVCKICRAAA